MKILVAESDMVLRFNLAHTFTEAGHEVVEADNGHDALAYIDHAGPDVVILDLMIAELDGYEVLRSLRAHRALLRPRVIVLTAFAADDDGFVDFAHVIGVLEKPLFLDELIAAVDRVWDELQAVA